MDPRINNGLFTRRNTSSSTGNASLRADFHFHNEMKMLDETKEESWKEDERGALR